MNSSPKSGLKRSSLIGQDIPLADAFVILGPPNICPENSIPLPKSGPNSFQSSVIIDSYPASAQHLITEINLVFFL